MPVLEVSSLCAIYGDEFPVCRAKVGAVGAKDLLELTPCDLFPYIRGRTLWLVGDSMMQVVPSDRIPFMLKASAHFDRHICDPQRAKPKVADRSF